MEQVLLKGKGDINKVAGSLIKELHSLGGIFMCKINREVETSEVVLIIFEKYYMRNKSFTTLTILISQDLDELTVDVIGSGGGTGALSFSWGSNKDFANEASKILTSKGFEILSENGD